LNPYSKGSPGCTNARQENVGWVEEGCKNLIHHIETVKKAGINPVVCINAFYTDTDDEIKAQPQPPIRVFFIILIFSICVILKNL